MLSSQANTEALDPVFLLGADSELSQKCPPQLSRSLRSLPQLGARAA